MPMVNGKKYPYTKAGKEEAAKAAKAAKAGGGMVRTKSTSKDEGADSDMRTPLPFMGGGGSYKAKNEKKKRGAPMRKAKSRPVRNNTKGKPADRPDTLIRPDRPDRPDTLIRPDRPDTLIRPDRSEKEDGKNMKPPRTKRTMRPQQFGQRAKNNKGPRYGRK